MGSTVRNKVNNNSKTVGTRTHITDRDTIKERGDSTGGNELIVSDAWAKNWAKTRVLSMSAVAFKLRHELVSTDKAPLLILQ